MITQEQRDLIASIQHLTLSGSEITGRRMKHTVQPWGDGCVWSEVRVIAEGCEVLHESEVIVDGDRQEAMYPDGEIATLEAQRDALAQWIAANRKQEEAA